MLKSLAPSDFEPAPISYSLGLDKYLTSPWSELAQRINGTLKRNPVCAPSPGIAIVALTKLKSEKPMDSSEKIGFVLLLGSNVVNNLQELLERCYDLTHPKYDMLLVGISNSVLIL